MGSSASVEPAEVWCCTENPDTPNIIYHWKIKNYRQLALRMESDNTPYRCFDKTLNKEVSTQRLAQYIQSSPFSGKDDDRKWCYRLYPCADSEYRWFRVYLILISDGIQVSTDFQFFIVGSTDKKIKLSRCPIPRIDSEMFYGGTRLGSNIYYTTTWVKNDEEWKVLANDCLQIVCEINLYTPRIISGSDSLNIPPNDLSQLQDPRVNLHAGLLAQAIEKAAKTFAQTLAELRKANDLASVNIEKIARLNLAELRQANDLVMASNMNNGRAVETFFLILAELRKANDLALASNMNMNKTAETLGQDEQ